MKTFIIKAKFSFHTLADSLKSPIIKPLNVELSDGITGKVVSLVFRRE